MGYPKLTGVIIGMIFVSMFAALFVIFINTNPYNLADTGEINITKYNRLNELSRSMQDVKLDSTNLQQQSGTFDLVGGFFGNAWKVLASIPNTVSALTDMTNQAIMDSNLGPTGLIIKQALEAILFCMIFIGIIIAALIKWVL